jgi:hypothetical protein
MRKIIDHPTNEQQDVVLEINRIFQLQKSNQQNVANGTSKERKLKLDLLGQC